MNNDEREQPLLLKVEEAAYVLSISRSKTYELIGRGVIPSIRVGSSIRVPREALEEWVANMTHIAR